MYNGAPATIVDWVEDPKEDDVHTIVDNIRLLKYPPVSVYLKLDKEWSLSGLEPGVFRSKIVKETFAVEINGRKVEATRSSHSYVLRANSTAHMTQGMALIMVDDNLGKQRNSHFSNTAYTRAKKLEDLRIIRFAPDSSRKSTARGLAEMNVWIEALQQKTAQGMQYEYRPNPHPPLPRERFAQYCTPAMCDRLEKVREAAAARDTPTPSAKRARNRETPQHAKFSRVEEEVPMAELFPMEQDYGDFAEEEDEISLQLMREGFMDE